MKALFRNQLGSIDFADWEWKAMRWLLAPVIWLATFQSFNPAAINIPEAADPGNGLAGLINLDFIATPTGTTISMIVVAALIMIYLWGKWMPLATVGLLVMHSLVGAMFASPAKHHHATQIVGMVLLGQAVFFCLWPWLKKRSLKYSTVAPEAVFWSQQMVVAAYVVSAISKWVNSGGGLIPGAKWVQQIPGIVVQFEKNVMQKYHDTLVMPKGAELNRGAIDFIAGNPGLAKLLIGPAFYLELFAFLALFNRRVGAVYGLALILMHYGIAKLMFLEFFHFQAVDFIFLVNVPFWMAVVFRKSKSDVSIETT